MKTWLKCRRGLVIFVCSIGFVTNLALASTDTGLLAKEACFVFPDNDKTPFPIEGKIQLLEDCDNLEPLYPPGLISYYGSIILICCPKPPNQHVLFPLYDIGEEEVEYDYPDEQYQEGAFDYDKGNEANYLVEDPSSIPQSCNPLKCMDRSLCDPQGIVT